MRMSVHCGSNLAGNHAVFHGDEIGDIVLKTKKHLELARESEHLNKGLVEEIKARIMRTESRGAGPSL